MRGSPRPKHTNKKWRQNNYYPFGLQHQGYNDIANSCRNEEAEAYKLNGKEYEDSFGLNIYEMDLRQLDPAIGRWLVQDPVIHHDYSPYSAFDNNPVYWSDPSGADSDRKLTHMFSAQGDQAVQYLFALIVAAGDLDDGADQKAQMYGHDSQEDYVNKVGKTATYNPADENGDGSTHDGNGGGDPKKKFIPNNNLIGTTAQSFLSSSIVFEGLSDSQLEYFRVIPEAAENNNHTIIPKNGVKYKTDGLYMKDWSESNYWFKIGDGRYVTVTYENGMYKAKDSSVWVNSIALQLLSAFNFKSINEPHWVNNPFNSK